MRLCSTDVNKEMGGSKSVSFWHQQLPLSLSGVAASGTLPAFREAQYIKGAGYYWDGLYSQDPPVHEFVAEPDKAPDELWIVRINPQQWPELPKTNAEIRGPSERTDGQSVAAQRAGFHSEGQRVEKPIQGEFCG